MVKIVGRGGYLRECEKERGGEGKQLPHFRAGWQIGQGLTSPRTVASADPH